MGQLQVPLMSTRPDAASQEPGIALIDDGPLPSVVRLCNRLSVHRLGSMQGRSTGQSRKTRPMYLASRMRALSSLPCERRHAPYRDGYRAVSTATQSIETRRGVRAAIAYYALRTDADGHPLMPPSARTLADEPMLALGGAAVQRCRFPVVHPSDSTGQGSSQSLGRVDGASHGELDLLVDLAGQAPGLILGPHEVRFLIALRGAVPS